MKFVLLFFAVCLFWVSFELLCVWKTRDIEM